MYTVFWVDKNKNSPEIAILPLHASSGDSETVELKENNCMFVYLEGFFFK